jgi:hypothetical protein
MIHLSPATAAKIANQVYDVQIDARWNSLTEASGPAGSMGPYGFTGEPERLSGTSGGRFIGGGSGFGYVALGEGPRQGEALVAVRGTVTGADGLTDAHCAFAKSPSGNVVHRGFALTFRSIEQQIVDYFRNYGTGVHSVHVVGHSLGGAVATLAAEKIALRGREVTLYTFGCPRVGDGDFSRSLTRLLGAQNIHRTYHEADPVSMVPIFPFVPCPYDERGHCLPWGGMVDFSAHMMTNYIKSVGTSGWSSLPKAEATDFFGSADKWLNAIAAGSTTSTMLSVKSLRMIMKALHWILDQVATIASAISQFAFSGATMVIDALSYLLYQGYLASVQISTWVRALLQAIMQFMGLVLEEGMNITVAVISYVITRFLRTITPFVEKALMLVNGPRF